MVSEELADNTEDTGCFADAGRTTENEVGNRTLGDHGLKEVGVVGVAVDFREELWSVLF